MEVHKITLFDKNYFTVPEFNQDYIILNSISDDTTHGDACIGCAFYADDKSSNYACDYARQQVSCARHRLIWKEEEPTGEQTDPHEQAFTIAEISAAGVRANIAGMHIGQLLTELQRSTDPQYELYL